MEVKSIQDITGNYWAIMDGDKEITSLCRADMDGNGGYTYEEAVEKAKELESN